MNTYPYDEAFSLYHLGSGYSPVESDEVSKLISDTSKTATEMNNIGLKSLCRKFNELARGAVKIVWVKQKDSLKASETRSKPDGVYYTAISSFFGRKERELKDEFKKMKKIESDIKSQSGSSEHLAVKGQELARKKWIGGKYTIKVEKAVTDFEKKLRNRETSIKERIILGSHLLDGLSNLHLAGYAHGDMKPENCLIYTGEDQSSILKISDFGKTEKVLNESKFYSGNPRFVSPEGKLSTKGDVYSAALILIRNFEEKYPLPLITVDPKDFDMPIEDKYQGIERYVVEHKAFLACNEEINPKNLKRRITLGALSESKKLKQRNLIHEYIDKLHEHLKGDLPERAHQLCDLLKQMTEADPNKRCSSAEASKAYQDIFEIDIKKGIEESAGSTNEKVQQLSQRIEKNSSSSLSETSPRRSLKLKKAVESPIETTKKAEKKVHPLIAKFQRITRLIGSFQN
jgi:hypothetical protein